MTFTAGVGENSWQTRKMLLDRLAPFGVKYDAEKNMERSKEPREVSTPDSAVKVLVIPTNEELSIAQQAMDVI